MQKTAAEADFVFDVRRIMIYHSFIPISWRTTAMFNERSFVDFVNSTDNPKIAFGYLLRETERQPHLAEAVALLIIQHMSWPERITT